MTDRARPPRAVTAWITAWVLGMLAVAVPAALALRTTTDLRLLAAVLAVVAAAELTELHFRFSSRLTGAFTLVEAAVSAALLLLAPGPALLAAGGGALLANLLRRRPPRKTAFNTATVTLSAAAAVGVAEVLPELGPVVGRHGIVTIAIAMAVYGAVNLLAMLGLMWGFRAGPLQHLRAQGWLSAAAVLGELPIGIIGAELVRARPALLVLLVAPAASVYLAYRGVSRTQELLGRLRADHDRLDRVVAGTSDGILLLDADGVVEVWNDALTSLTGIPGPAAVGQPVERVLAGVRLGDPVVGTWRIHEVDPGQPTLVEQAQLRHLTEGTVRTVRESHTVRVVDGRPVGDVVVLTDVTREQEVASLKTDFMARVSHELRTPLTPITGFATMLLRRGHDMDPQQQRVALERIVERSDRMASLVEDLLLVSELGDGSGAPGPVDVELAPVDLCHLVQGLVARLRLADGRRQVVVEEDGPVVALADEERTAQVLHHLLDNAQRYSEPDTPITLRLRGAADRVTVEVVDMGRGIAAVDHERVFEPFQRIEDPLRMTTSGVGLGLYICRHLARAMDGEVTVSSRPGRGATFTLVLPAATADDSANAAAPVGP